MTPLQTIIALNQPGRVGASSIYTAGVAVRMAEISQTYRRPIAPAAVIHIDLERFRQV